MDIECAKEIQVNILRAIEHLSLALIAAKDKCSDDDYEKIKKSIGILIGKADTEILCFIYEKYPELNHLKD